MPVVGNPSHAQCVLESDIAFLLPDHELRANDHMPIMASDSIKRRAANIVLARLGEEMIEVVKYQLKRSYAISFEENDNSKFLLDQLHFGLSVLLGEGRANNIMKQIIAETRLLQGQQSSAQSQ